jgi:thiosulfate/3-mercaptopyruvate sulfurtransferase
MAFNWATQLQQQVSRDIISKSEMENLMGSTGIDPDTTVILYGDNKNWFAAWAFWQMKYYGHRDVRMMDRGRVKWEAEGRPLVTEIPTYTRKVYVASERQECIRAYRDQVLHSVNSGEVCLVDVRSPDEYSGKLLAPPALPQEGCQRGGHIPGAANIPCWAGFRLGRHCPGLPLEESLTWGGKNGNLRWYPKTRQVAKSLCSKCRNLPS